MKQALTREGQIEKIRKGLQLGRAHLQALESEYHQMMEPKQKEKHAQKMRLFILEMQGWQEALDQLLTQSSPAHALDLQGYIAREICQREKIFRTSTKH